MAGCIYHTLSHVLINLFKDVFMQRISFNLSCPVPDDTHRGTLEYLKMARVKSFIYLS